MLRGKLICIVLACLPAVAQAADDAPLVKSPGDKVTLEIAATSQPNRAPVALHFDVIFPVQRMEMENAEAGSAATNSGKSLQCNLRNPHCYACVLSGGDRPVADGQIAIFHFKVKPTAQPGQTALRIENAVSTTVDSKVVSLNGTETVVIIR